MDHDRGEAATSLPEMIILRKVLSVKLIAVLVGVVGLGTLGAGLLFSPPGRRKQH